MNRSIKHLLALSTVLLAASVFADTPPTLGTHYGAILRQSAPVTRAPGTGLFAPGSVYSFLGVATLAHGEPPDWSLCGSTTLGAYDLAPGSWLSVDALAGLSFTHSAADGGFDVALNLGSIPVGRNGAVVGGKFGAVALYAGGHKAGYGVLVGGYIRF